MTINLFYSFQKNEKQFCFFYLSIRKKGVKISKISYGFIYWQMEFVKSKMEKNLLVSKIYQFFSTFIY